MLVVGGGVAVSVVWGYFADLPGGEVGWFLGRLVFVPTFTLLAYELLTRLARRRSG